MSEIKTLEKFKSELRKAIDNRSLKEFENLVRDCVFETTDCSHCPLSKTNETICLRGHLRIIYWRYLRKEIDKETALSSLILFGRKMIEYTERGEK